MKKIFFAVTAIFLAQSVRAIEIKYPSCDYSPSPAIAVSLAPAFGWKLVSDKQADRQTAYQIILGSDSADLSPESNLIWNTSWVGDARSQHIAYDGDRLLPGKSYVWKVRVKGADGDISDWSDTQVFHTPPEESMWTGSWIGAITRDECNIPADRHGEDVWSEAAHEKWSHRPPLATRSIMLRKEFAARGEVKSAKIYISGLGHYRLSINGEKVSTDEFAPLWSDYDKTVYYNIYDITDRVRTGANVFGVVLGNGFYNIAGGRYIKFYGSFGPPTLKMQAEIQYANGSRQIVSSDRSWKYDASPVTYNCLFGGEDYDATLEQPGWDSPGFDAGLWKEVVMQKGPSGRLTPQMAPPVKIIKNYAISKANKLAEGTYLFDMGQNLSGFPSIKVSGQKGDKVKIIVAEILTPDGTANQSNSGGPHTYEYTLKGEGIEKWRPSFSYYGFQYIQVEGCDWNEPQNSSRRPVLHDVSSAFIHLSAPDAGTFECSNEIFNRTHFIIDKATRSNMQAVFTDCPHREKLGWLEETQLNGPGLFYNYDLTRFMPKVMRDIADAQTPDGLVPDIAPEYVIFGGGFRDSPEWGSAAAINPWNYYIWYGDDALLKKHYPTIKKYADYLADKATDNILSHGLGDWMDHSDKSAGVSHNTPIEITATGHFYYVVQITERTARMLGNQSDAEYYGKLAADIRESFNRNLFDSATAQYGTGSQCSNALPLVLGIAEEQYRGRVLENLVDNVKANGYRLTTGDVGNRYLYQALAQGGRNDVMYRLHNHYDVPGYGYQIKVGVTSLAEQWDPSKGASWNHFMMGQIEEWFYKSLAGIKADESAPGFAHFLLEPETPEDLTYAKGSYESLYGTIISNWKIEGKSFIYEIEIPVNTTAAVSLPSDKIKSFEINSKPAKSFSSKPILKDGKTVIEMPSGKYTLSIDI